MHHAGSGRRLRAEVRARADVTSSPPLTAPPLEDPPASSADRDAARARGSLAFLVAGLAVVGLLVVSTGTLRGWLMAATSLAAAVAGGVAARRDGRRGSPVSFLFLGAAFLVPANVLWYPARLRWDLDLGSPSVTDALFLAGYLAFVVGLIRLVRLRGSEDRRLQLLDSLIISVGLGVLAWVIIISPYMREDAMSSAAKATAVSYPVLDLVLLGAVIRLLVQGRISSIGDRLLTMWVGIQLAADLTYTVTSLRGAFSFLDNSPPLYALSYVLLGAALLHPSALRVERRTSTIRPVSVFRRLTMVATAALIAPAVLIVLGVRGESGDVPIVALLSAVMFGLVILRIGILMVDVQEHRRIQEQLRESIVEERRRVSENRELLMSLRERQALSDRLFRIQRKISTRAPLQDVLDAITAGAAELLRDEVVGLRLVDPKDPDFMQMVSLVGVPAEVEPQLRRLRVGDGVGGRAVAENRLCIQEAYDRWEGAVAPLASFGARAAMGTPVHLEGHPIGSLAVASLRDARAYSMAEQEILIAFAEHVSLALNDARTVQVMNEALDQALEQAMHDNLTGLPNRACFYDRTEQALRTARREATSTAVLLFDLDRFKEINDTLGHRYGDRVLREIGPRIRGVLRESDTLARLGGDEFCVLLPEVVDEAAAAEVAQRIIAALEEPFEIDGMLLAIEASCGITVAPGHGDTADLLLQRADVAMYVAKTSHADIVAYHHDLDVNTPDRLALLGELRVAIATDQLVLHFQPQASLDHGAVEGFEALVRWEHPRLGFLGPDQFVPIAEDTGLIKPLTAWVLDAALAQLREWLDDDDLDLPEDFSVSINLSTRSLLDESFHDEVVCALERAGVPANRVVFEVTETTIMADPARAHRLLTDLAAIGVRFAIDDFGTGYSSLASLKVLPVHLLKIDKSFVLQMHEVANDATIVRSVIELGRTLGLRTVAEGVEVPEVWAQLGALGCDSAQGYLLARPMAPAQVRTWMRARAAATAACVVG